MLIYYLALTYYWLALTFVVQHTKTLSIFKVLYATFPLLVIMILRGNVGTDTVAYLGIVSDIGVNANVASIEHGFVYLIKLLLLITKNNMFVLVLIAIFTTIVMLTASAQSYRSKFVLLVCVVPIFYLDMTMNGLRYGLSFAFAMYAVQKFYSKHEKMSVVLAVISVLIHSSSILIFLIFAAIADNKEELRKWLLITGILFIFMLGSLYLSNILEFFNSNNIYSKDINLTNKFYAYKYFKSPSWLSGLSTLIMSALLLLTLKLSNKAHTLFNNRGFYIVLVIVFITFVISKFSYAGLRLQSLVLFCILLIMQFKPSILDVLDKQFKRRLLLVGFLGTLTFIKNAIQTEGQQLSPFAPWAINPDITHFWSSIAA